MEKTSLFKNGQYTVFVVLYWYFGGSYIGQKSIIITHIRLLCAGKMKEIR